MKTNDEWITLTDNAISWRQRYPLIEDEFRHALAAIPTGEKWTTKQLVYAVFPDPRGVEGGAAMARLFKVLEVLCRFGMKGLWQEGKPSPMYGKLVARKVWTTTPYSPPVVSQPEVAGLTAEEKALVTAFREGKQGGVMRFLGQRLPPPGYALEHAESLVSEDLKLDDFPLFSVGEGGCWVSAWVWAAAPDIDEAYEEEN